MERPSGRRGSRYQSHSHLSEVLVREVFGLIDLALPLLCLAKYHLRCLKIPVLASLAPIQLFEQGLFTRVTACHIMIYYCAGFAYMMLRRYVDASTCFRRQVLTDARGDVHLKGRE